MSPETYHFTLNPQETQLIIDALGNIPINVGFELFLKLKNEIIAQEAAADQKEVANGK